MGEVLRVEVEHGEKKVSPYKIENKVEIKGQVDSHLENSPRFPFEISDEDIKKGGKGELLTKENEELE